MPTFLEQAQEEMGKQKKASKKKTPSFLEQAKAEMEGGLEGEVAALEEKRKEVGAPSVEADSPGLFRTVLDLISRPGYAVGGALEETFSPYRHKTVEGPGRRFVRELLDLPSEMANVPGFLAGMQGDKAGGAEILERAGVGELGRLSETPLSRIPNPVSFPGVKVVEPGSPADITGRGAVGFAADIATDPLTYVTAGTGRNVARVGGKALSRKGVRELAKEFAKETAAKPTLAKAVAAEKGSATAAGRAITTAEALAAARVPGSEGAKVIRTFARQQAEDRIAAAIEAGGTDLVHKGGIRFAGLKVSRTPMEALRDSGISAQAAETLAGLRASSKVFDSVAKTTDAAQTLFRRFYRIRGLEGADREIVDKLDKGAFRRYRMEQDIKASPLAPFLDMDPKKRADMFKDAVDAFEKGSFQAIKPELRAAMGYMKNKADELFQEDVAAGLINPNTKVTDYFAHMYLNDPEDFAFVYQKWKGEVPNFTTHLGRFAKPRSFPTLKAAREWSEAANKTNKTIPVLLPNYDPVDALTRRWEASIQGQTHKEMAESLTARYGLPDDFKPDDFYDLTKSATNLSPAEANAVKQAVSLGKTTPATLNSFSDAAKTEFFRQRFAKIATPDEARAVFSKYVEGYGKHFPKTIRDFDIAADGTKFVPYNTGKGTYTLPLSLVKELDGLNDRVFQGPTGEIVEKLLKGFDAVNNFWKASVTWAFPAFHSRNAYSNVSQAFSDMAFGALNPNRHGTALALVRKKVPGVWESKFGTYTYDELRDLMRRHGVLTSREQLAEFQQRATHKRIGERGRLRAVGGALERIENKDRAQLFLTYLERGLSPQDAAARVKKVLIDYEHGLTPFERQVMRRLIPFYTFNRLAIPQQVENLVMRPGFTSAQLKTFRGRDSENEQMTTWEANALKLRLNRDGRTVRMLTGVDLPIRNLDILWRGTGRGTMRSLAGMITPVLKMPMEFTTGKSLFTDRDFDRTESRTVGEFMKRAPTSMQQWFGYKETQDAAGRSHYTFDGERFYVVFQAYALSRFLSTSDRAFREYLGENPSQARAFLDFMTGLRVKDLNLDEQQERKLKSRQKQLEEVLVRWGERKRFETTYPAPAGQ